MFGFLKQVGDYTRDAVDAARNLAQGFSVTFDHMKRRPVTFLISAFFTFEF